MSEGGHRPDRFGCAGVALTLAAGLTGALAIAMIFWSPEMQSLIEDFLNEDLAPCLVGQGACQGRFSNPPVGPSRVPVISERYFDLGTSHAAVTGALSLSGDLAIDTIASYVSNQGRANIVFGPPDPNALLVQVTFNEPEDTVTVIQGDHRATGMDADCAFNIQVTDTLVAGHISCPAVDAFNGEENVGSASIELEFSAGSLSSGPDGGDPDATAND
jgi:hypothetical protein